MIIFFYGENIFKAKQKINDLKNKFFKEIDPGTHSFNHINGPTTDLKEISQTINTGSLFTKKRLTLIENIFANKKTNFLEEFLDYLKENHLEKSEDIIVFYEPLIRLEKDKPTKSSPDGKKTSTLNKSEKKFFEFLKTQKFNQEFKKFNQTELNNWIKEEISKKKGVINNATIQLLVSFVGQDLWKLNNEIEKLINYKKGGIEKEITRKDIEKICYPIFDSNIFELTDAIGNRNKPLALKILEDQNNTNESSEYLLSMILRQFKIIFQLKNSENGSAGLGLHPYVAKKTLEQTKYFTNEKIKEIINELINLDYLNKSGKTNLKTGLSILISKI